MFKLRKIITVAIAALSIGSASSASAGGVLCSLPVISVGVTPDGSVFANFNVSGTSVQWWLCNVSGSTTVVIDNANTTITSAACQATFSQLLSLRASGTPAQVLISGPTACTVSALPPSVTIPNPYPSQFIF